MRLIAEQQQLLQIAAQQCRHRAAGHPGRLGARDLRARRGHVPDQRRGSATWAPRRGSSRSTARKVTLFKLGEGDAKIAEHTMKFRFEVTPEAEGPQTFLLEAVDAMDNRTTQEIVVEITVANRPSIAGKNYALIIGNGDYEFLPRLKTAAGDAEGIAEVLDRCYDFDVGSIVLLTNASRREILGALSRLRRSLTVEDRLLIYYVRPWPDRSGHVPGLLATDRRRARERIYLDIERRREALPGRHARKAHSGHRGFRIFQVRSLAAPRPKT